MRIGCLQFAPRVGEVDDNLSKADALLDDAATTIQGLDLLVLPELAFSGYNFKSREQIDPFLEAQNEGVSSAWARSTALKHGCTVIVGYPERAAGGDNNNADTDTDTGGAQSASVKAYNSAVIYDGEGGAAGNYRKTQLYYTDETWALEGDGFFRKDLPGLGMTAVGICMDLNPYKFQAPWDRFEFARHAVSAGARLVILSMAWLTNEDPLVFASTPSKPDAETLLYWFARLEPIIDTESEEEVIVVFANRCGSEGEATYAGSSSVIGIRSGLIHIYGSLGRGEEGLLVIDTDAPS